MFGPTVSREALLKHVGNTPLLDLSSFEEVPRDVQVFAKLESCNPGGSIKDRPVAWMLARAMAEGRLEGGRRLLDSSSGNAGIAYAMYGAALGIPVTLVVPGNASRERLDRIRAHGAELIISDPLEGYDFALREALRLGEEEPERYWHCNQYANDENWKSHYYGTAEEILLQTREHAGGPPDAFVAGVGTGGTLTGVGRRLRKASPSLYIVAVIPEVFPGIEGLKPLGDPDDIVPEILDEGLIDERVPITSEDALRTSRNLARRGVFVGPSSGAYVWAAFRLAQTGEYRTIITVLSDGGERYASTGLWGAPP